MGICLDSSGRTDGLEPVLLCSCFSILSGIGLFMPITMHMRVQVVYPERALYLDANARSFRSLLLAPVGFLFFARTVQRSRYVAARLRRGCHA